ARSTRRVLSLPTPLPHRARRSEHAGQPACPTRGNPQGRPGTSFPVPNSLEFSTTEGNSSVTGSEKRNRRIRGNSHRGGDNPSGRPVNHGGAAANRVFRSATRKPPRLGTDRLRTAPLRRSE